MVGSEWSERGCNYVLLYRYRYQARRYTSETSMTNPNNPIEHMEPLNQPLACISTAAQCVLLLAFARSADNALEFNIENDGVQRVSLPVSDPRRVECRRPQSLVGRGRDPTISPI